MPLPIALNLNADYTPTINSTTHLHTAHKNIELWLDLYKNKYTEEEK